MNRYQNHCPDNPAGHAIATFCNDEFGGRACLRRVLSRLGLRANEAQEETLLELIHRSDCLKQHDPC